MSEQEQERPLTRRELREQAAQESAAQAAEPAIDSETAITQDAPVEAAAEVEIDISPFNEDGSVRTRRELRALREAAYAELQAERGEASEAETEAETGVDVDVDAEVADDSDGAESSDEVDDWYGPPTEAFSIEELIEAGVPVAPTGDADAVAALFADDEDEEQSDDDDDDEDEDDHAEASDIFEDLEEADESVEVVEVVTELDEPEEDSVSDETADEDISDEDISDEETTDAAIADEVIAEEAVEDEVVEVDDNVDAAEDVADVDVEVEEIANTEEVEADSDDDTDSEDEPAGYSFPDIQPPEEWRSVFDDPSRVTSLKTQGGTGDFDDLISRAVAQEGSTGGTGISALILPSHPGDTGGLAGPLGVTGELFVTGSIELPKSLGETGGHAALLDSVESDQFLTGELTGAIDAASNAGPTPVSALNAVSARRRPEIPVVAEPTKDKSKMPIILALSGGGLLIILAGAVILAATQGWFA